MAKTQKEIENCLSSELDNMMHDVRKNKLTEQDAYNYFARILLDAEVNSKIVVNVLERKQYGEYGQEEARNIKVAEGW